MIGRLSKLLGREDSADGEQTPVAWPTMVTGKVFVFAGGGLRHMRRPTGGRDDACSNEFLGYRTEDLFWRDVLKFVHPDEAAGLRHLIRKFEGRPGVSIDVKLRMLDALGRWRWTSAVVQNVLEAPDGVDGGLLVVGIRDLSGPGD